MTQGVVLVGGKKWLSAGDQRGSGGRREQLIVSAPKIASRRLRLAPLARTLGKSSGSLPQPSHVEQNAGLAQADTHSRYIRHCALCPRALAAVLRLPGQHQQSHTPVACHDDRVTARSLPLAAHSSVTSTESQRLASGTDSRAPHLIFTFISSAVLTQFVTHLSPDTKKSLFSRGNVSVFYVNFII